MVNIISYHIAVFQPQELRQTFVFMNGIKLSNDAFPINRSLRDCETWSVHDLLSLSFTST